MAKKMLNSTSTTQTKVDSKSRNPFVSGKEPLTKYGELIVIEEKKESE